MLGTLIVSTDGGLVLPDPPPPLAIVDLARAAADLVIPVPPPCPLIGIGDPGHPAARLLDAVIEAPVGIGSLVAQITKAPLAAAATVQLLRSTETAAPASALVSESLCYAMLQGSAEHRGWLARQPAPSVRPAGTLTIDRLGDRLRLGLARPESGNAIDVAMRDGLHEAFTLAALDPDIARVELTGIGRSFSLGAELGEFGTTRDPATAHLIRMRTLPARAVLGCAARLAVHVRGACVGAGLEIAAFAARLTASADAWFQLPELAMGILPGAGGTVSLPRRIGRRRAALMMLSGRRIGAARALEWGLIDAIVDAPPFDEDGANQA